MQTIKDILIKYHKNLNHLDLELIIAHIIKKSREFVLAHPEHAITKKQEAKINKLITRRMNNEPLAYILGRKEFFGIDFKINRAVLIPRPETELLVDLAIKNNLTMKQCVNETMIIDVGTGSGNIIISLAKNLKNKKIKFIGVDISEKALLVARYNAKKNKLDKKIKFIKSDLLSNKKLFDNKIIKNNNLIIVANLPYLSKKIYNLTNSNVKNYEPKSALYSPRDGLQHYEKLLKQTKKILLSVSCSLFIVLEFSPEQKTKLNILIKKILPSAQVEFTKDLAKKWRICAIKLS